MVESVLLAVCSVFLKRAGSKTISFFACLSRPHHSSLWQLMNADVVSVEKKFMSFEFEIKIILKVGRRDLLTPFFWGRILIPQGRKALGQIKILGHFSFYFVLLMLFNIMNFFLYLLIVFPRWILILHLFHILKFKNKDAISTPLYMYFPTTKITFNNIKQNNTKVKNVEESHWN